ncbi:MAG: ABC transporter permease subunit [Eubacteriales bacterium]
MSKKKKRSLGIIIKSLFLGSNHLEELNVMEEEEMASPFRTIVKNFLENKIAMTGAFTFSVIFILSMTLPIFFPLDTTFQDSTQQNTAPGFSMLSMPKSLQANLKQVSVGSTFSLGLDNDGNLYQWGTIPANLQVMPSGMRQLDQVSAGVDHALGLSTDGTVYTWGNSRLGLGNIPIDVQNADNIVKVYAGQQLSFAITEDGKLYFWGNENLISVRIPSAEQGNFADVTSNSSTAMAITTDGRVFNLANQESPFSAVPDSIQGNTTKLAMTTKAVAALSKDGYVTFWGGLQGGLGDIPEEIQGKVIDIAGGRSHFSAVTEDGRVYSWGSDYYGESTAPSKVTNAISVTSGSYQNYVETSGNTVVTWGLSGYLMGTDHQGRDVASRLASGGRLTMTIGAVAVIIQSVIGIFVGGMAGFYGGKVDNFLMRLAEVVGSIPFIPLAMILSALVGNRLPETARIYMIMVILGVISWPGLARLIRGQVLAEREKEFVTAARAMGLQEHVIIFKHILPNVITVIIVSVTLSFASSMLTETSLSFLGFGVLEPNATWGNMLTGSQSSVVIRDYWWRWVFPALALSLSTISINLIGDGLRNAIDPKSNER